MTVEMDMAAAPSAVVTYKLGDLYGALFYGWRRFLRLLIIIELLWIILSVGANVVDGATLAGAAAWLPLRLLGWGALALAALWFGLCPLLAYARIRRAGLLGPNRILLVDRGIRLVTPKADSVIYWPAIRRTVRTSSRLYLFLITAGAIIVPRRAFGAEGQFEAFVDATKERWNAR
jgi:hypothetical protein